MAPISEEAPHILSEVRRLMRVLMAEMPQSAEQHFLDMAEMRKVDIDEDLGAYEFTQDGSSMYIVFDHGTKYTTSIRPSQIPDAKIVRIDSSPGGDILWKRLQQRANDLKELSDNLFKASRIGDSLNSIPFLYSTESNGSHFRHIDAVKGFGGFLELTSDEAIRSWCNACSDRLIGLYGNHLLAGNEVIEPLATLLLFDYCPFPLATLLEMNHDYLRYQLGDKFMGANLTMPFPVPNIKFYLEHPVVPANVAVVWGTPLSPGHLNKMQRNTGTMPKRDIRPTSFLQAYIGLCCTIDVRCTRITRSYRCRKPRKLQAKRLKSASTKLRLKRCSVRNTGW